MTMLILIRGLPGSGKTTFAHDLLDKFAEAASRAFAADDFFTDEHGEYNFDASLLPTAHAECQRRTDEWLDLYGIAIVHNTFTALWEMQPYFDMAAGERVRVYSLFDRGLTDSELYERGTHGVPLHVITNMRERWEPYPGEIYA